MKKAHGVSGGWIYNLDDYRRIFNLTDMDLKKKILDFPGCVSSVNADMRVLGHQMVSGDQSYDLSIEEMRDHAKQVLAIKETNLKKNRDLLSDASDENLQKIFKNWEITIEKFLQDYSLGKRENRYQVMTLPKLAVEDSKFDLALCSDLLFHSQVHTEYSAEQLINELCRIAIEVRVYPLLDEKGKIISSLGPIILGLHQRSFGVEVKEVPYRMRKGGNAILRIWSKECAVEMS